MGAPKIVVFATSVFEAGVTNRVVVVDWRLLE